MGRVNYSYKDKYLLTASIRSDGSSHLIQKYSTFPSVALGWVVSKEDFMAASNIFSDLKVRASYGVTGNQAVPPYATINQVLSGPQGPWGGTPGYYFDGSALTIATILGAPVSKSLKWEKNTAYDAGIDASFLRGRLLFTVDAYYKKITDLLYNYQAPFYNGGGSYIRNMGSLENKGIEFALGGTPVATHKVHWSTNLTLSFNRNKVLSLGGLDSVVLGNVGSAQTNHSILIVGRSLGNFYGYQYLGTWKTKDAAQAAAFGSKPGDAHYTDIDGDNKYTSADMMVIGNGNPRYSFGFINDVSYGNFTLSVMIQGTHGNSIYSGTFPYTFGEQGDARHATNRDVLNRWTPGHETDIPAFSKTGQNFVNSSRWVYDGSYVKLKNLSIGYRVPQSILKNAKMRSLEIYVSGQNLFSITNYPGYDPEVSNANYGIYPSIAQGLETGVIPNPRTYTFGIRAGF
jgi:TonB-linked SusC/RagA family outer membrane protein